MSAGTQTGLDSQDVRKKTAKGLDIKIVLDFVQALAIVVGGCWVLFLYFSYQRNANRITLEQQKIALEQSQVVQNTYEQSNALDLALKKLSVEQGKLLLATSQAETQLRRQELISSVEIKKQDVLLNELKRKQQAHDVEYQTSSRYRESLVITARKIRDLEPGVGLYKVETQVSITNTSSVPITVEYWCVDYYATEVPDVQPNQNARFGSTQLTLPPDRFQPRTTSWHNLGDWSAVYDEAPLPLLRSLIDKKMISGSTERDGLGTGVWKAGQVMDSTVGVYVRAPHGAIFSSAVSIIFDNDQYLGITKTTELPAANSEPVVAEPANDREKPAGSEQLGIGGRQPRTGENNRLR